jgi:hypothetical protein
MTESPSLVPGRAIAFDAYQLDVARHRLWQGDREIPLRPKSWDVLCYLVERPGLLVTKEAIHRERILESIPSLPPLGSCRRLSRGHHDAEVGEPLACGLRRQWLEAFRQGLRELDYVEGQNIAIESRWAGASMIVPPPSRPTWSPVEDVAAHVIVVGRGAATQAAQQGAAGPTARTRQDVNGKCRWMRAAQVQARGVGVPPVPSGSGASGGTKAVGSGARRP